MLTRSANASPSFRGYHYAPAHSPHLSPSQVSAALSRRQSQSSSTISMTSPSHPRPRRWVGVDAATQYSPMETAEDAPVAKSGTSSNTTPLEPPPTPPGPVPMEPGIEQGVEEGQPSHPAQPPQPEPSHPQPAAVTAGPSSVAPAAAVAGPSRQMVSPHKRRSSEGPNATADGTSVVQGPSTIAKRPKASSAPPKVLPQRYELCAVEDVVVLIANMLGELIETNDALALKSGHLTRFHSRTAPGISVLDYLHRLAKHATLSPPLLLSMVYYIDRLCALYPDFTINTLTVHRFLITAATVAAKGLSDSFWNNSTYARVGGVRVAELKLLELEFLYRVDWKIVPNPEVLVAYYRGLVERSPGYVLQGEEQGAGDEAEEDDDEEVLEDEEDGDDEADDADDDGDGSSGDATSESARDKLSNG